MPLLLLLPLENDLSFGVVYNAEPEMSFGGVLNRCHFVFIFVYFFVFCFSLANERYRTGGVKLNSLVYKETS